MTPIQSNNSIISTDPLTISWRCFLRTADGMIRYKYGKGLKSIMSRSYKSSDARVLAKSPDKVLAAPAFVEEVVKAASPQAGRRFQPGDIVSFRSNTRGEVLSVIGNGVQVDFGLGPGWFTQQSLTLIKAGPLCQ